MRISTIRPRTEVHYRNRQTGEIVSETIFSEGTLRWFYEDPIGAKVFTYALNNQVFWWLYGKWQDGPWSRSKIKPFVNQYGINVEEAELPLHQYRSFNAFFSRRLKPDARPWSTESELFCAPSDGKVLVYPQLEEGTRLPVKGSYITLESLLTCQNSAKSYHGGSALIVRLAPVDYHRFHFPDDGKAGPAKKIKGRYHSVNPIALAKVPDLYCRNKRAVTKLFSRHFGRIAYVEVGAITVGSIIQTYTSGPVSRGQEKGYFRYGGSGVTLRAGSHQI